MAMSRPRALAALALGGGTPPSPTL